MAENNNEPKNELITDYDLQPGEGTNIEIIGVDEDPLWLVIDEDALVQMIQMAFDAPEFTIDHLIEALLVTQE